jgi:hypothetical protein
MKEHLVTLTREPMSGEASELLRKDAMAWCRREGIPFLEGKPDRDDRWIIYTETTDGGIFLIHFRFFEEDQAFAFKMRWQ